MSQFWENINKKTHFSPILALFPKFWENQNFSEKSALFFTYDPLTSCKKLERTYEPILRTLRHERTSKWFKTTDTLTHHTTGNEKGVAYLFNYVQDYRSTNACIHACTQNMYIHIYIYIWAYTHKYIVWRKQDNNTYQPQQWTAIHRPTYVRFALPGLVRDGQLPVIRFSLPGSLGTDNLQSFSSKYIHICIHSHAHIYIHTHMPIWHTRTCICTAISYT